MTVVLTKDWEVAVKLCAGAAAVFPKAADTALLRIAIGIEGSIKSNIVSGPPPPQSRHTTDTGGGGVPLNRTGGLSGAPATIRVAEMNYFIGVPRSSGSFNLAVIHEEGALVVQEMTARMRKFLHARLSGTAPGGGVSGFVVSQIPARPFVGPAVAEVTPQFGTMFVRNFAAALGGKYGRA
jgi:hypothetical protein